MLLKILRLLRGYVGFTVVGLFPERFLNLINIRGIPRWDFLPVNGGYTGKMYVSDYRKIRPLAKKASVRLKIRERRGVPFFVNKYKRRRGLLIGAVIGALIIAVLSRFVWSVEIVGAEEFSKAQVYSVLEECGLKVGMLKSSLRADEIEREVELKIPRVKRLSVNAVNNTAVVEIKEKAQKPKLSRDTSPCNIKAECDAVITDIFVRSGTCEVKRGSAVSRNELLVNCVVASRDESLSFVHSEAEIYADVKVSKQIKIPKSNINLILKPEISEKTNLRFLIFDFPEKLCESKKGINAAVFKTERIFLNSVELPLGRYSEKNYYFSEDKRSLTLAQAKKIMTTRLTLGECFSNGKNIIKKRSVSFSEDKDYYILNAEYVINKNIAVEQKVSVN